MSRRVSGLERIWLAADRLAPPFANQLVLEAAGGDLTSTDWAAALAGAARSLPGLSVVARGALGWTRWAAGPAPRLLQITDSLWDGMSGGHAPFLARPLDPRRGPVAELVVVQGAQPRVIVRTHHAASDGLGTLLFARAICAAARGEPLPEVRPSEENDAAVARSVGATPEAPPSLGCPSPLGPAAPAPLAVRWVRRRVEGGTRQLLPRVAVAVARAVPAELRAGVRIDVPVDLRRHRPGLRDTGNLTGLIRLPMAAPLAATEPVAAVAAALGSALAAGEAGRFVVGADPARWVPLWLMERLGRRSMLEASGGRGYSATAAISNLGRMDMDGLRTPGFTPQRAFFVPPGSPGLPLFLTLTGDTEGVTLCGSAPLALAGTARLEHLMDRIIASLAGQQGRGAA